MKLISEDIYFFCLNPKGSWGEQGSAMRALNMKSSYAQAMTQLFMLFQMVASVFSLHGSFFKILQQPIWMFEISSYCCCHGEENAGYHVKEHKKLVQKQVSQVTLHFAWGQLSKKQTVLPFTMWIKRLISLVCPTPQKREANLKLTHWLWGNVRNHLTIWFSWHGYTICWLSLAFIIFLESCVSCLQRKISTTPSGSCIKFNRGKLNGHSTHVQIFLLSLENEEEGNFEF